MGYSICDDKKTGSLEPNSVHLSGLTLKDKTLIMLKQNPFGLTVSDISRKTGVTRHTVSVILAELRGAGMIEIRKVGMAKVHILKPEIVNEVFF